MVFSVKTFNNINQIGLKELGNAFQIDGDKSDNPDAYILRSQNLHGQEFPSKLKAIARAGAGTNNIPVDQATAQGIVVFNTPGDRLHRRARGHLQDRALRGGRARHRPAPVRPRHRLPAADPVLLHYLLLIM